MKYKNCLILKEETRREKEKHIYLLVRLDVCIVGSTWLEVLLNPGMVNFRYCLMLI